MAYVNGKRNSLMGIRTVTKSEYDLVITSEDIFSECLYPLYKNDAILTRDEAISKVGDASAFNTPSPNFTAKRILVKGVTFKQRHGYDDVRLHIFQPSIEYIKFENCRWETYWTVSGKVPTTVSSSGTQYNRAPGDLNLVIDGIDVSSENVQAARDAGEYWYIGLRNVKALINSTVHYPEDYDLVNGWNFKLTCQYFDYASNNHIPALWDGANISDCYIIEKLVRCTNCTNIKATPVLRDGKPETVAVQNCTTISNFSGSFTYYGCKDIDYYTCEGIEDGYKPYDYIIRSMSELNDMLSKAVSEEITITGKRILLRDFTINTTNTIDFKWAGFVGFSNMLFRANITITNVWELDGAGLDAANNKYTVTINGENRTRVYNIGRLPTNVNESEYIYDKCTSVHGCCITAATRCFGITSCYVSKNSDALFTNCSDISGIFIMSPNRTANTTFELCANISNIVHSGTGKLDFIGCRNISNVADRDGAAITFDTCVQLSNISRQKANTTVTYNGCGSVDYLTCTMYKVASDYYGGIAVPSQSNDGKNGFKYAKVAYGGGFIPIRDSTGNIELPSTQTADNQALSLGYAKTLFSTGTSATADVCILKGHFDGGYNFYVDGDHNEDVDSSGYVVPRQGVLYCDMNSLDSNNQYAGSICIYRGRGYERIATIFLSGDSTSPTTVIEGYYWEKDDGSGWVFGSVDGIYDAIYIPETGKIYIDLYTNKIYQWDGTAYIPLKYMALPEVTEADEGKILKVVNGKWKAVTP